MTVRSNHGCGKMPCPCMNCEEERRILKEEYSKKQVEYTFTQELMDEYNHYKELVDTLIKRVKTLESGEGF